MNEDYVNPMIGTSRQVPIIGPFILHVKTLWKKYPSIHLRLTNFSLEIILRLN